MSERDGRTPLRLEWRTPQEIDDNPANWRTHPESQMTALAEAVADVGWAGACLYNERTGRLIDGHARKRLALEGGDPSAKVPVLVGDWSEEDERKILLTLDPIGALAGANAERLADLIRATDEVGGATAVMLKELSERNGVDWDAVRQGGGQPGSQASAPSEFPAVDENIETAHECPRCHYRWSGNSAAQE